MFFPLPFWAQAPLEATRKTQFAGSWYNADPDKLRIDLDEMLENASPVADETTAAHLTLENQQLEEPITAIVVPHAGYAFSGQAAAHAYGALGKQKVNRIFMLGPSHHVGFHGAALPASGAFATPLGDLPVDRTTVDDLSAYPLFAVLPEVHKVEHSLEMQLPFIRRALGAVPIIPVIVGQLHDESEMRLIAEVLRGYIADGDLLVVSSDFTHYGPRYDYQPFEGPVRPIVEELDRQSVSYLSKLDLDGFVRFQHDTKDTICGFFPCAVMCALLPAGSKVTVLKYYTSQDCVSEDSDNSVSYIAMACSGKPWPQCASEVPDAKDVVNLSEAERQALLTLARKTLDAHLNENRLITPTEVGIQVTEPMKRCFGAFVTLYKPCKGVSNMGHGDKDLRGCIGSMWPVSTLWETVQENAIAAAVRDPRFPALHRTEMKDVMIEINVLTPPRRIKSKDQIVIGRDGIIFAKSGHNSVFLPHVMTEFGWTVDETLRQLAVKAGLRPDDAEGAKLDIFQSEIIAEEKCKPDSLTRCDTHKANPK
jgi:AmmeMemoRadiSam system protein B/AmmeMemoRadiSam system protein A